MNKLYIFILLLFGLMSCGNDDMEQEEEVAECAGDVTITVDGADDVFGTPLLATLVELPALDGTELAVLWTKNGVSLNFQVLIDETELSCFPVGRIELKDLPANISLLSFQYVKVGGPISSVSNVFIEDGGDGWVDIKSCSGDDDKISAEFEFDAVTAEGDLVQIRGGSAQDICFKRTK